MDQRLAQGQPWPFDRSRVMLTCALLARGSPVVEGRPIPVDNYRVFGGRFRFRSTAHTPSHLLIRWSQVRILPGVPQQPCRFGFDHRTLIPPWIWVSRYDLRSGPPATHARSAAAQRVKSGGSCRTASTGNVRSRMISAWSRKYRARLRRHSRRLCWESSG